MKCGLLQGSHVSVEVTKPLASLILRILKGLPLPTGVKPFHIAENLDILAQMYVDDIKLICEVDLDCFVL